VEGEPGQDRREISVRFFVISHMRVTVAQAAAARIPNFLWVRDPVAGHGLVADSCASVS
jgi:hypothetical protein